VIREKKRLKEYLAIKEHGIIHTEIYRMQQK
jgi:hypothetical protein